MFLIFCDYGHIWMSKIPWAVDTVTKKYDNEVFSNSGNFGVIKKMHLLSENNNDSGPALIVSTHLKDDVCL